MMFLNFGALFGLAAVGIPVVIHLLNRMQVKEVHWAAMRFLLKSARKNKRRMQIEDLLLLLLRCLLVALLVLVLARPAWRGGAHFADPNHVTAVVIVDHSASMGLSDGVHTSFERAQNAAEQILQTLPSGSSAALYFASNTVRPVIAQPTLDLDLVRQAVHQGKLTDRSTDLREALQLAISTLQKQQTNSSREVYVVTDGQANGWGDLNELAKELGAVRQEIAVHIVLVGGEPENNLAITELRLEGGLAPVNQPLRCSVEVTNEGETEVRNVQVNLFVDAQPAVDQTVVDQIAPGSSRRVALFAKLGAEGYHTISAKIPADRLAADDQRTLAVKAVHAVKVLLVAGATGPTPPQADDFFLRNALVPVPSTEVNQYYVKTTTVGASQLAATDLTGYDAVFLSGVEEIDPTEGSTLAGYVHHGGGLVVFPGPGCKLDSYNRNLAASGFLPATLGAQKGDPTRRAAFFTLQTKDYEHPVVTLWNDPASGTLAGARFYAYYPLTPAPAKPPAAGQEDASPGPARVLAHFEPNGDPLAVERAWGAGRVVVFASTATTAWNDLPVTQAFVPLVHRVLGFLVERQTEGLNIRVGEPFSYGVGSDLLHQDVSIRLPGQTDPARVVGQVALRNALPTVEFGETDRAGAYQVSIGSNPATPLVFAAQPDPRESALTPLSDRQKKALGGGADFIEWGPAARNALAPKLASARAGRELWLPLLIAALLIATAETFLAQWFAQSK